MQRLVDEVLEFLAAAKEPNDRHPPPTHRQANALGRALAAGPATATAIEEFLEQAAAALRYYRCLNLVGGPDCAGPWPLPTVGGAPLVAGVPGLACRMRWLAATSYPAEVQAVILRGADDLFAHARELLAGTTDAAATDWTAP